MTLASPVLDRSMHLPITDPATGLRRSGIRYPDGQPPAVDGCRWCGAPWFGHGKGRLVASRGSHYWEAPTSAQCAARKAARPPVPPAPAPVRPRCDEMNHNSVGGEVFCQLDPGHEGDHDDEGGVTWERED